MSNYFFRLQNNKMSNNISSDREFCDAVREVIKGFSWFYSYLNPNNNPFYKTGNFFHWESSVTDDAEREIQCLYSTKPQLKKSIAHTHFTDYNFHIVKTKWSCVELERIELELELLVVRTETQGKFEKFILNTTSLQNLYYRSQHFGFEKEWNDYLFVDNPWYIKEYKRRVCIPLGDQITQILEPYCCNDVIGVILSFLEHEFVTS